MPRTPCGLLSACLAVWAQPGLNETATRPMIRVGGRTLDSRRVGWAHSAHERGSSRVRSSGCGEVRVAVTRHAARY
jgi:hypothetical protein